MSASRGRTVGRRGRSVALRSARGEGGTGGHEASQRYGETSRRGSNGKRVARGGKRLQRTCANVAILLQLPAASQNASPRRAVIAESATPAYEHCHSQHPTRRTARERRETASGELQGLPRPMPRTRVCTTSRATHAFRMRGARRVPRAKLPRESPRGQASRPAARLSYSASTQ